MLYQNKRKIAILISTYNGEKYIAEQLNSLLTQSFQDFSVYIRDDYSTDKTLTICQSYHLKYPNKIFLLEDQLGNLGAKRSFSTLTSTVVSDFYMYCDQDDVWLLNKIYDTYSFYQVLSLDSSRPTLVYTDAKVVDSSLNQVYPSLIKFQGKNPYLTFHNSIFNGVCLGCSTFFNKALRDLIIPISDEAVMHDSWLTKTALITGEVHYLDRVTLLYRQHKTNVYGLKSSGFLTKVKLFTSNHNRGRQVYIETLGSLRQFASTSTQLQLYNQLSKNNNILPKIWYLVREGYISLFLMKNYRSLLFILNQTL